MNVGSSRSSQGKEIVRILAVFVDRSESLCEVERKDVMVRDSTTKWDNFDLDKGDLEALYQAWNNTLEFVNYG